MANVVAIDEIAFSSQVIYDLKPLSLFFFNHHIVDGNENCSGGIFMEFTHLVNALQQVLPGLADRVKKDIAGSRRVWRLQLVSLIINGNYVLAQFPGQERTQRQGS